MCCCKKLNLFKKTIKNYLQPHLIEGKNPAAYEEFKKLIYLKSFIGFVMKIIYSAIRFAGMTQTWNMSDEAIEFAL